jgi:hypothetical protein
MHYRSLPGIVHVGACASFLIIGAPSAGAQQLTFPERSGPVSALASATPAADEPLGLAIVKVATPVLLTPDTNAAPVRVAKEGSIVTAWERVAEWYRVDYNDPQRGRSIGYVRQRDVTLVPAINSQLEPLDVSTVPGNQATPTPVPPQLPAPNAGSTLPTRRGGWFNLGFGFGSLGCENCDGQRDSGLSGGISLGGTINEHVLMAIGTSGFAKSVDGEVLSAGTYELRVRAYPSKTHGFFINGGVGLGRLSFAGESEVGVGLDLGIGWDIRVGKNVSLTPFYNEFAMRNDYVDANVGQLGLGVTIH